MTALLLRQNQQPCTPAEVNPAAPKAAPAITGAASTPTAVAATLTAATAAIFLAVLNEGFFPVKQTFTLFNIE